MNKAIKWLLYLLAGIVLIVAGLYIYARITMGSINATFGEGELSSASLSSRIKLPPGFSMGVYAANIPHARLLRFTRTGDLLVAVPSDDKILLLGRDANGDGKADYVRTLIKGLNGPNGMDFYKDWLYIAETDAIGRVKFNHETGRLAGDYEQIVKGLPGGGNHWQKRLRFGPDGLMYVTLGSSCNVCIEKDKRRATMMTFNPDGSDPKIFATGLRNSAGFDWRPADGQIYATDNGRDGLGDNFPPCEFNLIKQGQFYGWPFANGNNVPDPDLGEGHAAEIANATPPVHGFRAHNAPLGMVFVRGDAFPPAWRGTAIVALHGSWNRSEKDGYKVVALRWDEKGNITESDFVTGFLKDGDVIGRPAEVAEGPDGAIYIADDYAGAVYRVAYGEEQSLEIPQTRVMEYNKVETLAAIAPEERERLAVQGEQLFKGGPCLNCHGDAGVMKVKLEHIGDKYDVDTLVKFLERPRPPMPIIPHSTEERKALAVYLIKTY